jgi:hypothetical protein
MTRIRQLRFALLFSALATAASTGALGVDQDPERSADLTSAYLDLSFVGSTEIRETPDECLYRIPSLAIRLNKLEGRLTSAIYLDEFHVTVAATDRSALPEIRHQLIARLTSFGAEVTASEIVFAIPKGTLAKAEYIAFSVRGRVAIEDDGRFAALDPASRTGDFNPEARRAIWPITARSNVVEFATIPNSEQDHEVRRSPA